jgi:hypothetical protein
MQYFDVDYHAKNIMDYYRRASQYCNPRTKDGDEKYGGGEYTSKCNIATANLMQERRAFSNDTPVSIPIPRDFLTLTHQPEAHPYYPASTCDVSEKTCKNCDCETLPDHRKHQCFECSRRKHDNINGPSPSDPNTNCFFYNNVSKDC